MSDSTELHEKSFPGLVVGKAVVDKGAKYIGVVKAVKLRIPDFKTSIVVQGFDSQSQSIEIEIDSSKIEQISDLVMVNEKFKNIKQLNERDILKLRLGIQEKLSFPR